ncbi:MAG TPA: hypothetical protein VIY48_05400 [Candidatus Paceibacterota bacterium]
MDALRAALLAGAILFACLAIFFVWLAYVSRRKPAKLARLHKNPVLEPDATHWWESEAVFNPAAFVHNNKIHLLYRALGHDGVSRIGYAVSDDGIHFKRFATPAYDPSEESLGLATKARKQAKQHDRNVLSYENFQYDRAVASGGGWGGSEDPRAVVIDDEVWMTFTAFEGWENVRMTLTRSPIDTSETGLFNWDKGIYLSPPGEVQKNWILFPEKIRGKFALITNVYPEIEITYFDPATIEREGYIQSKFTRKARTGHWDTWIRGAGAPPLKTKYGWLLLYHAIDEKDPGKYKVGAMLLDLKNPKKVLYRATEPILEPDEWYENDWKPGVVYATGAVIFNGDLIIYYGGGDKFVAAARENLDDFASRLMHNQPTSLEPVTM